MITPQLNQYQFVNSTIFNNANGILIGSTQEGFSNDVFFIPGLINQASLLFSFNNTLTVTLTMTNSGVSAFKALFQTGAISGAFGTANGTTTNIYTVDLSPFVPSSGNQVVYIVAQFMQIQQVATTILGPPAGHPDYSPNFDPTFGYTQLVNSLNIFATTTVPDNQTTLELARVTLTAGQTIVTAVDSTHQIQARVNALYVTMAGDVTGLSNNNIISNLQGNPVSAANPTVNYVFTWNGINWVPAAIPPPISMAGAVNLQGYSNSILVALMANLVYLRNPITGGISSASGFNVNCYIVGAQSGAQLNGRDQAAAFGANTFFHLYVIGGPTVTTGSIASLASPPIGPNLPAGYTSWAYLGTLITNGSGNVVSMYINGNRVNYSIQVLEFAGPGENTTPTSIDLSSSVPAIAQSSILSFYASNNSGGTNEQVFIGPDTFAEFWISRPQPSVSSLQPAVIELPMTHNNIQKVWYYVTHDSFGNGALFNLVVMGYTIPNNAS